MDAFVVGDTAKNSISIKKDVDEKVWRYWILAWGIRTKDEFIFNSNNWNIEDHQILEIENKDY